MRALVQKHKFLLLAFATPLAVRAVPEILMGSYLIGFDPLGYYIPVVLRWLTEGVDFWHYIAVAPLFYSTLMQTTSLGIPLALTLKIMPPLLHGFLALTIYFYASRALKWSPKKSLFTSLLATLYFVALRTSWDLLRNQLALAFLFITLTMLQKEGDKWKRYMIASLTMVLVVLTNQLVAVIMLAIATAIAVHTLLKKEKKETRNLVLVSTPATLLFLLVLYANYRVSADFPATLSFPGRETEGWLSLFGFSSYWTMATTMLGFLLYCYLPLLPLTIKGAKLLKNFQIRSWTLFSLIAIPLPIIFARTWYRWVLMLTYPLAFYVVEALANMKPNPRRLRVSMALIAVLTMLTVGFMVLPSESPFPYYAIPQFQIYVPSSMLQNTVPLSDCQHVVNSLSWLENNMNENSVLLTHTAFHGWALLTLKADQVMPYGYGNPEKAAENASQQGYDPVYLIWWTEGQGWHGQPTAPASFKQVYRSGNIAIYLYEK